MKTTSSQMFLGTAAALIASSSAFIAPMAVRSAAPASSSSSLKMQSAGAAYLETLPGAPFGDGKVSGQTGPGDRRNSFVSRETFGRTCDIQIFTFNGLFASILPCR